MMVHMKNSLSTSWPWWLCMTLIALAPSSTKFAGAAFFLFIILATKARLSRQLILNPSLPELDLAKQWMYWCLLAFGVRAIAQLYWDDPWSVRHFDIRLMLGAVATWWLMQYAPKPPIGINLVIASLITGAISGLIVVFLHVQFDFPTPSNRINWAVGLAFMCCLLISLLFIKDLNKKQKKSIWIGMAIYLAAIFFSGVRGAYFIFPWVLFASILLILKNKNFKFKFKLKNLIISGLILLSILYIILLTSNHPASPIQRITVGIQEVRLMFTEARPQSVASETSMGIRISMWARGIELIEAQPWMGHGLEQRMLEIKNLGKSLNSPNVENMTHFHSEYINNWVEHGILGISSTLIFMFGLAVTAWRMFKINTQTAIALTGIALLHITASVTNLNSRHNNYGVMLALCMIIAFYLNFAVSKKSKTNITDEP
jgi:O-antigen ligase